MKTIIVSIQDKGSRVAVFCFHRRVPVQLASISKSSAYFCFATAHSEARKPLSLLPLPTKF